MDGTDRNTRFASLQQGIATQARSDPDGVAISAPGRSPLTYRQLHALTASTLARLNAVAVSRGDRVAMVLPNGPEMAAAFLSVAAGASAAPLNPAYQATEFEFYLSDLKAKVLMIHRDMDSPARAVAARLSIPVIELIPHAEQAAGSFTLGGDIDVKIPPAYSTIDDEALVLHTSGTTSRPKLVPLTQGNICASARSIAATLALTRRDVCLNIMPLFHIHGLMAAVMASLAAGAGVVCSPGFNRENFFGWLKECRPTWFTAVPTMHMAILEAADHYREIVENSALRFIRSSSASLPPRVMARMEEVFNAPMIEAYGMTEAAHQIASNPLPPAVRKPGSVGFAAGPDVTVMNESGAILAPGTPGEIVIRGANVTPGYANNPQANSQAFTRGWFRTGDQGRMDEGGYLYITGRLKEIINRGGEKVSPREVDEALLEHPDVAQAVAFAVPHDSLGEDIAAAVVLKDNARVTGPALRQGLFGRLADFKIPNKILVVDEIPKGPTGKIQRIGLAQKLSGLLQNNYTPPRTALETTLAEIFAEALDTSPIGVYDNFFSAGGDSLSGARVIARIRDQFRCELPVTALFRFPSIAEISGQIRENTSPAQVAISRNGNRTIAPLSLAQQRLWLLEQLDPQHSINNVTRTLHLHGELNTNALESSINKIIDRHDIMRTTFVVQDLDAVQYIHTDSPLTLTTADLTALSSSRQKEEVTRLAGKEASHSFDLTHLPLIRLLLIQLGRQEHVLIITLHHMISDGWSMGILSRELEILYRGSLHNDPSPLPEPPIQYADFAEWQRRWLLGPEATPLIDFWKHTLWDAPRLLLPFDRPYAKVTDYRAARRSLELAPELTFAIKQLGQEQNCSLFMTVLAGLNALLHRYTGATDIVIGAPVSGRHGIEQIQGLVGFFVNTIALRADLSSDPSFRQLLGRMRTTALNAYQHSALPFDKVVEVLRPDRHEHRNPLFDVMINIHEAAWHEFRLTGLNIEEWQLAEPLTDVALTLDISLRGERLHLSFKYQTALFDQWRIDNMLQNLRTLLEGCCAEPDRTLSTLPLLSAQEYRKVLVEWNETQSDHPANLTIPELFENQALATPDATALVFEDRQLSYAELNSRANQLAHFLIAAGVKADQSVALLMNRSHEVLICILAVLKAGGAYVPLDPKHPRQRLKTMIDDAAPKVLLTTNKHWATAKDVFAGHILHMEQLPLDSREGDTTNPNVQRRPEQLAYVLYTSGSTGAPKGVMVQHDSVINLAYALQSRIFDHADRHPLRVALNTAITFDASVQQWTRLLWGDCLVILSEEVSIDPRLFSDALKTQGADVLGCTPTQLRLLFAEGLFEGQGDYPKIVLCGGEAMDPELWTQSSTIPGTRFYNVYGPTECTVDATCCRIEAQLRSPSIGRPLANVTAYILDENRNPLPIGIQGELWLGGLGVARGYLNKPGLTHSGFFPDPFNDAHDSRIYKTGDLARYLPDGDIEYLGRSDFQVKLRGFRIEPGEIESVLRQHAAIKDCVVIIREDTPGDQRLTAYVIPEHEAVDNHELISILKAKLPEYMVPAVIVRLEAFPLSSSGKIDRKALPAPAHDHRKATDFTAPRTLYEKELARVWAEILSVDNPSIHDNFFELGGHSLLATRIIARINRDFGIQLPLRELFENPTLEGLAQTMVKSKSQTVADTKLMDMLTHLENLSDADAERLLRGK